MRILGESNQINLMAKRAVWFFFAMIAAETLYAVPKLSWELAADKARATSIWIGLAMAAAAILVAWRLRGELASYSRSFARALTKISTGRWLFLCIAVGVALRVLWVFTFPAPQRSDHATYFALAENLAERTSYLIQNGGYAYWPPGYSFFLFANFLVFGVQPWVPLVSNLLLFAGTILVVHQLASRIGGPGVGRVSTLLLVFWPTYVTSAGLASKEQLLLFLIPLVLLLFVSAVAHCELKQTILLLLLAGATLGFACLTQPSFLLFPGVLFLYEWLRRASLVRSALRLAFVVVPMFLVIAPWTLRNYRVLHAWVLVSTNGGYNFYRANNPFATGSYVQQGEWGDEGVDEVQRAKLGFQRGIEWIRANPGDFLRLAGRKQILFLGDDSSGVYETLKRGLGIDGRGYFLSKGLCNLFWWGVWILVFATMCNFWETGLSTSPEVCALMLSVAYLFSLHSVFESGAKYHGPLLSLVAVLAGLLAWDSSANTQNKKLSTVEALHP